MASTRWQERTQAATSRRHGGGKQPKSKQQRRQEQEQEHLPQIINTNTNTKSNTTETDRRITQTHSPQPPLNHDRLADLAHHCKSPTDSVSAACLQTLTRPGPRFRSHLRWGLSTSGTSPGGL
ncbi:hypothetical protein CKAH01_17078 [Colletotrichum kahawae]|uniref:Uncharacterized protein n=1 Tax=Colletotrichum kahawae TaxID=34407 RepID=A0AAD9YDT9_COLKA|nr:hypothetical protein CKAH01_17078 [Colletotrichum kahawae]